MPGKRAKRAHVNIAEAKAHFSELIERALLGEEVVIAKGHKPVAKIVRLESPSGRRKPGSAKGKVRISPDFDEPLEDFENYR